MINNHPETGRLTLKKNRSGRTGYQTISFMVGRNEPLYTVM